MRVPATEIPDGYDVFVPAITWKPAGQWLRLSVLDVDDPVIDPKPSPASRIRVA